MRRRGPELAPRTAEVLRRSGLEELYDTSPKEAISELRTMVKNSPENELMFAISELAYIEGKRAEQRGQSSVALDHFGMALTTSYQYLFSPKLQELRNPYDPQFRGACDLYNEALEDALRLLCSNHTLRPGQAYTIETPERSFTIETVLRGKWAAEEFGRYEFVSDYRVETLRNRHTTYGLGVPLIAIRTPTTEDDPRERHYPDGLSYAVTAMLRCFPPTGDSTAPSRCILEFYDPLSVNQIRVADRWVPLETDLTTPLAFFLDSPQFRKRNRATEGLLNPAKSQEIRGLYMLEPYDPNRIPVVMVHGLWSSPLTWMDMFNDLRSYPDIRKRYQFCFYMYPSGQPFWISAAQMREDLSKMRDLFDPKREHQPMEQMVLVGHSMGGLVSRLQTIESKDDFWRIVSDQPKEKLKGSRKDRIKLASVLSFRPNQAIQRVITIATPHHGSEFANKYTRWLARKLIKLPSSPVNIGNRLAKNNPHFFNNSKLLLVANAIDSLAPDSPIFPVMLKAQKSPFVKYHNIVGLIKKSSLLGRISQGSDGVVDYDSAHVEDVQSEVVVTADHTTIHTKAKTIQEVRRILQLHLNKMGTNDRVAERPEPSESIPSEQENLEESFQKR